MNRAQWSQSESNILKPILRCALCQNTFGVDERVYRCDKDNFPLEVEYDFESLKGITRETFAGRSWNMWRYRELLPILDITKVVSLGEGGTALWKSKRLAKILGLKNLYLKDETRNPTWSFKDRGSSVGVSKAMEIGATSIGCVSSGNMAASLSTYAAQAGMKALVLIRTGVPNEKIIHILVCGARVVSVDLPYPVLYQQGLVLSNKYGVYSVHSDAPMRVEGQKTSSLEICEQLGWNVPDKIIVPTSSGGNMSAHWKAWKDLNRIGLVDRKPSMIAVQNEAATPIHSAFVNGDESVHPVSENPSIATSIVNPDPPSGLRVLKLLRDSRGLTETVDDDEMLQAQRLLGQSEGTFVEPGGCSSIAALKKLVDKDVIDADETIVAVLTGAGIKDVHSAMKFSGEPSSAKSVEELERFVKAFA